jgi:DNA-binding CsgD family transcriptional regulator
LPSVSTRDALQGLILSLRDLYEVEHLVYHSLNATGEQYATLTYDPDWVSEYIAQGYVRLDPVVSGCFRSPGPVHWKDLDWSAPAQRRFLGEALAAGVGSQGLSMPVRGPAGQFALFTVNHSTDDEAWARQIDAFESDLILIGHYLNQKALDIDAGRTGAPRRSLSPREVDVLSLLALGHSRASAADALNISEHTLRVYVEGARLKLGANNTTHAVAAALTQGLIAV